nr:DUF3060 domain-containing protein [Kofleriaceae bacterium]
MKRPLAMVLAACCACLLGVAPALADKTFNSGTGATVDCGKDPKVSINHGSGTYVLTGKCEHVSVNGGQNKLTIESVDSLDVNGSKNTIAVDTVGKINVNGGDNSIAWKHAAKGDKPTVTALGKNNAIAPAR